MWMLTGTVLGYILGEAGGAVAGFLLGVVMEVVMARRRRTAERGDSTGHTPDSRLTSLEMRMSALEASVATLTGAAAIHAAADAAPATTVVGAEPAPVAIPEPFAAAPREEEPRAEGEVAQDWIPSIAAAAAPPDSVAPATETTIAREADAQADKKVAEPATPSALTALMNRLLGGNLVARIGVVTLFFGVGFLLRYAYRRDWLPPWLRLIAVAAAGIALIVTGWRLLPRRRLYGLILQGAGVGLLYLDVYFALKTFGILSAGVAFVIFMVLGIATLLAAVRLDARPLAVLGLLGAFLAPVLAARGTGNHVVLFSYYALLNGLVLATSWFKAWRELNLIGFFFTFVVGIGWGAHYYRPELFWSVEPFVLLFFVMYLIIPILFATRQPLELRGLVDGSLVFGTPLATAVMQAGLASDIPNGPAWSAAAGGAIYAAVAAATLPRAAMRLLGETYVALAVFLFTMAIFFACDAYPTFALWTLEGAAIVWVGLRQQRWLARAFGVLLQIAAAVYFLGNYASYDLSSPLFNDFVLGCLLIAVAAWISARLLHQRREALSAFERAVAPLLLGWGCLWYFIGGLHALHAHYGAHVLPRAGAIFSGVSFGAMEWLGSRLGWKALRAMTAAHVFLLALLCVAMLEEAGHPLAGAGWFAWPFTFAVLYADLYRQKRDGLVFLANLPYVCGWLLLAVLATLEGVWRYDHEQYVWTALLGLLGIAVGYLRYHLRERGAPEAHALSAGALLWGLAFWFAGATGYSAEHFPGYREAGLLLLGALSAVAGEVLGRTLDWPLLRRVHWAVPIAALVAGLMQWDAALNPFTAGGWLGWPAAIAVWYWSLHRQEREGIVQAAGLQHAAALFALVLLAIWELRFRLAPPPWGAGWPLAVCGLVPALALWFVSRLGPRIEWPFAHHFDLYRNNVLPWLAAIGLLWSVIAHASSTGDSAPIAYVPLLNPLDIAQAGILMAVFAWLNSGDRRSSIEAWLRTPGLPLLGFYWLNAALFRTLHHWAGIPFAARDMLRSGLVQATLSLAWTATALLLMFMATAQGRRRQWMTGAALLVIVVAKLFLNDLRHSGALATIVSFIGVGGLLMLTGYLAPVPPGEREEQGA